MKFLIRTLGQIFCVGVICFSIYGFMATFEPLEPRIQITFRLLYGATSLLAGSGCFFLSRWK